ncbi:MAG: hypothetical protein ACLQOO_27235 [Terriglobia bacterium]
MAKTKIVYAVEMLHYLPLYLAHKYWLSAEFDIELAPAPYGDKAAVDRLMSTLTQDQDVDFCVCDPMMVSLPEAYSATSDDWPVVIGQIVGKVPFWAVNHRQPAFDSVEEFGSFSQIFAYPAPNTGYVFGELIHRRFHQVRTGSPPLREKPIGARLETYLPDGATNVVIEADILLIRKFIQETENKVVFSFARSREYKAFCFTALLTRRRFLEDRDGQGKARKLANGLQRAVHLIYNVPAVAADYAVSLFTPCGYSEEVVRGALQDLVKQELFPNSLVVDRHGWQKSVYVRSQIDPSFKYPSFRKFVFNRIAREEHLQYVSSQADRLAIFLVRNLVGGEATKHGVISNAA